MPRRQQTGALRNDRWRYHARFLSRRFNVKRSWTRLPVLRHPVHQGSVRNVQRLPLQINSPHMPIRHQARQRKSLSASIAVRMFLRTIREPRQKRLFHVFDSPCMIARDRKCNLALQTTSTRESAKTVPVQTVKLRRGSGNLKCLPLLQTRGISLYFLLPKAYFFKECAMNTSAGSELTRLTILIVDDTPVNVAVLAKHLGNHGFSLIITQPDRKNLFSLVGRQP